MQPISSYLKDSYLRVLLQGPGGVGKTTLACHFPKAYIIDLDVNLAGPLAWLAKNNRTMPVGYDLVNRDEKGVEVAMSNRYDRLNKCLQSVANDPAVETIIIDSGTNLAEIMMAHTLREQKKAVMGIQDWGFFFTLGKHFVGQITNLRKHVILICHEKVEKDEFDGSLKYFIYWPGQLQNILGALFTDVWRCEVMSTYGTPPTYKWYIRTMPDQKFQLKNSLQLPAVFEFKWETIATALASTTNFVPPVTGK